MTAALACLLLLATAAPDDPPAIPDSVRDTQVTLLLDGAKARTQLQATVIAKDDGLVTVLTAAHGIGPEHVGAQVRFRRGEQWLAGRVDRVDRNPFYRPRSGDIPGADNAFARIRLDDGGTLSTADLHAAELTAWASPDPDGAVAVVRTLDQFGRGHVVKAGNYSNPRWLEWGPAYRPVAGDSGSGVFVLRKKPDGEIVPVLVGVVVDRSERGGGASLLSTRDRWVAAALATDKPAASSPSRRRP